MADSSTDFVASPKQEMYDLEQDILSNLSPSTPFSSCSTSSPESTSSGTPEPTAEKKPVKKRKSWGQELPTPTTNLPPRKRAKTEAEKEQRRIERVLRNRAAAQSSRERKRKEVEALEGVKNGLAEQNTALSNLNRQLSDRLERALASYESLQREMRQMKEQWEKIHGTPFKSEASSSPQSQLLLTPSSISHDSFSMSPSEISTPPPTDGTLDPATLSTPCKLEMDPFSLTQHTAVMLCPKSDLQCQLTGPSSQALPMETIMRWILCLVWVISQGPLSEIVMYMMTNQQIPDTELLRFFPLIRLLASLTTTQALVYRLRTLSPTLALLMDATGSVRWFESTANELELFKWNAIFEDGGNTRGPAGDCRLIVMALERMREGHSESSKVGHGKGYEVELIGRILENTRGRNGFDFNRI